MTLFIYNWSFITRHDFYKAITAQKISYYRFTSKASSRIKEQHDDFKQELEEALKDKDIDAIFTINFMDDFAYAAHERGIPYICWTYDSPALLYMKETLTFDTTYIFVFDYKEYLQFKGYGVEHIYYLPLAVNTKRLDQMWPSMLDKRKYSCDVSLVGQLYQSYMDDTFPLFDEYGAGYIAAIINTQLNLYGYNIINELINENVVKRICNKEVSDALVDNLKHGFYNNVEELHSGTFKGFLSKAVTNKERVLLLSLLAKYFNVKLYSPDEPSIPNLEVNPVVDYVKQMPLVFKCSKINLNITLRNIASGIPQRVLDILGCHGLALTNYQSDLDMYFKDGRDLLIYRSMEEALDKCRYYLAHETEASRIRQNGYQIVRDQFSYEHQLSKIWELTGLKSKLEG